MSMAIGAGRIDRRTFCTWELTRLTVLSHVQEKGCEFARSKGDVS